MTRRSDTIVTFLAGMCLAGLLCVVFILAVLAPYANCGWRLP